MYVATSAVAHVGISQPNVSEVDHVRTAAMKLVCVCGGTIDCQISGVLDSRLKAVSTESCCPRRPRCHEATCLVKREGLGYVPR